MHKRDVSRTLEEIGRYLQIEERNRFRSMAYINAARRLDAVDLPMEEFVRSGAIQKTPGIGKATGQVIEELVRTGKSRYLEELRAKYPQGIFELLRIPGLGLRKIGVLFTELGISNVDELEAAIDANRLLKLRNFGAKTQQKISDSIKFYRSHHTQFLLPTAFRYAESLVETLKASKGVEDVAIAGSLRRRLEVVGNANLCVVARDLETAASAVESLDFLDRMERSGDRVLSARSRLGLQVQFHLCGREELPTTLFFFTGTNAFTDRVVVHAKRKAFALTAEALEKNGKRVHLGTEEELFRALEIPFIAPELREEAPKSLRSAGRRLVEVADLQGTFHVHSTFSDGKATIYEMLDAASGRGLAYVGMSDHSPTAGYAGGLSEERLAEQHAEIEKHRKSFAPMRVFLGTESDILMDGSLDYPPEILAKLDFVVASVHSRFKMPKDEMTERMIRALRNPFTTFLGHPTGRLLLSRAGYELDFDAIFEEAGKNGVMIEINGNPHRLDLDWRRMQRAVEAGVRFSIHPDAHSVSEMNYLLTGTWNARKGGLGPEHIFNTLPLDEVERHLVQRRTKAIKKAGLT
jgi:DNA polymerase (family 10)